MSTGRPASTGTRPRTLLTIAAVAVALAAADTYVVVLALPQMMAGVGLSIDELHQATPIISGFLLGYVAVLPLIGRLADLVPRRRVLLACLGLFVVGSAVTALSVELPVLVGGRVLQGIGGGGLVPATLALVADLWEPRRRGLPLGMVSAVQEVGSVLGPLLGAAILAVADWRAIFWVNVLLGALLAVLLVAEPARQRRGAGTALRRAVDGPGGRPSLRGRMVGPRRAVPTPRPPRVTRRAIPARWPGLVDLSLLIGGLALLGVALWAPYRLVVHVSWGIPFVPFVRGSRLLTPIGLVALSLLVAWLAVSAPRWRPVLRRVDLWGALLVAVALGALVLTFASADPEREVVGPLGWVLVPVGVVAVLGYVVRHRRAAAPLIPRGVVRRRVLPAVLVSLAIGAALVAIVVDVPVLARLTVTDDQTQAAYILVRFLVAVPVGAVLGGWLLRSTPPGLVAAPAMLLTCGALMAMANWGQTGLAQPSATGSLIAAGLGLGAAVAPVNAAALSDTEPEHHGVVSALVVLARMVGMIVGLALLTAIGLRRFYAVAASVDPGDVVGLRFAGVIQVQTVFAGAAWAAAFGALVALWLGASVRNHNRDTSSVAGGGR